MSAEGNVMALLDNILSGSPALMAMVPGGINDEITPRDENNNIIFPHIIVIVNSDVTRNAIGIGKVSRVLDTVIVTVKCVDQSDSYDTARQIMDMVDDLLSSGYNDSVLGFIRQGLVKYSEPEPNPPYRHYGHMYLTNAKD